MGQSFVVIGIGPVHTDLKSDFFRAMDSHAFMLTYLPCMRMNNCNPLQVFYFYHGTTLETFAPLQCQVECLVWVDAAAVPVPSVLLFSSRFLSKLVYRVETEQSSQ